MSQENLDKPKANSSLVQGASQADGPKAASAVEPILPEVVREEVRKRLPPDVTHAMAVQVAMGGPPNAFVEKLQPEHINKVLDYTREEKTQGHRRQMLYFCVGVPAFLVLCIIFLYAGKDAMLKEILTAFVAFAGGLGVGKWSEKK